MIRRNGILPFALVVVASVSTFNLASNAQAKRLLVTQKIDNSKLTTLVGNTRPEANTLNDRGPVSADLQMDHMLLLLKRPAELDAAATQFVDDLHNPKSANFHKWISAAQFGQMFGPASTDIAAVTGWLDRKASPSTWCIPTICSSISRALPARSRPPSTPRSTITTSTARPILPMPAIRRSPRRWRRWWPVPFL